MAVRPFHGLSKIPVKDACGDVRNTANEFKKNVAFPRDCSLTREISQECSNPSDTNHLVLNEDQSWWVLLRVPIFAVLHQRLLADSTEQLVLCVAATTITTAAMTTTTIT